MKSKINAIKCLIFVSVAILLFNTTHAQQAGDVFAKNKNFSGAVSLKDNYNVIFQLDTGDSNIIKKTFININNALNDQRLKNKIHIELIAFAYGTNAYFKNSKYENDLRNLVEKGVTVAQCNNTLIFRKISRDSIYNFIGIVPSGVGELILRQSQGWAIIKP